MANKIMYHSTDSRNIPAIMKEGIKPGIDGCVYMCNAAEHTLRFATFSMAENISVIEFEVPEEDLEESFDHSEAFFRCKAWITDKVIPPSSIKNITNYSRK